MWIETQHTVYNIEDGFHSFQTVQWKIRKFKNLFHQYIFLLSYLLYAFISFVYVSPSEFFHCAFENYAVKYESMKIA